ncbi:MAG: hypothetical protein QW505_06150 [Thermoplasmata archaeon]
MNPGKKEKKCPKCESDLHYVEKAGQHYCFSCEAYFDMVEAEEKQALEEKATVVEEKKAPPPEVKAEEPKTEEKVLCPSCGEPASIMDDTKRYYCYSCEDYIDSQKKTEEKVGTKREETATPAAATAEVPEEKPAAEPLPVTPEVKPAESEEKAEPPEAVIVKELEREERRTCQDCGSELVYVQKYDRWYCRKCRKYAPKEPGARAAAEIKKCPTCNGDAKFIEMYDRWYCYRCKAYLPVTEATVPAKTPEIPNCPTCGKPLSWIAQYQRYYCYACKKYPPRTEKEPPRRKPEGPICPDCGKQTTWIQTYERYYCYPCKKYVQVGAESKPIPERPKKSAPRAEPEVPTCEVCGRPTTWIAQYERYYCYPCKKYVPAKASKK